MGKSQGIWRTREKASLGNKPHRSSFLFFRASEREFGLRCPIIIISTIPSFRQRSVNVRPSLFYIYVASAKWDSPNGGCLVLCCLPSVLVRQTDRHTRRDLYCIVSTRQDANEWKAEFFRESGRPNGLLWALTVLMVNVGVAVGQAGRIWCRSQTVSICLVLVDS